ncbi:MAG: hypothetical protein HRT36_06020 [Alphaproteobacteria bacterium]|nr:hypothetical protein [Alphaproteobacteria bacterium]
MSSSYVTGSGANAYTALGGLFRARLKNSKSPKLQALAQQLDRQDQLARSLQEVINPKGFVGIDGKMKYIPGISFSNNDGLFGVLKKRMEISDESMRRQIDAYARKRTQEQRMHQSVLDRRNALKTTHERLRKARSTRQKARTVAMAEYLSRTFGINKRKKESSPYRVTHRPEDFRIFGSTSGHATDFIKDYAENKDLTMHFSSAISYDWNSNVRASQSVKISDYRIRTAATTPTKYVVRLTGNAGIVLDSANRKKLPNSEGKLFYVDSGGATKEITDTTIAELTAAEFDTLKYVMDFSNRTSTTHSPDKGQVRDYTKFEQIQRLDFLSVMAVASDPADPTKNQRGYISKIAITKGKFAKIPSASGDQTYKAKMLVPTESYFTGATLRAEGTLFTDGSGSMNASDGTLLDMINEGRVEIFAREIGYNTRLTVDTENSKDNKVILGKGSLQLLNDGVELFLTVTAADRNNIDLTALSLGLGRV